MPRPLPVPLRRAIWNRWQAGHDAPRIAAELSLAPRTVRHRLQRFRDRGAAGLDPDYRHPPVATDAQREAALTLRREHPRWGAPLIRSLLRRDHPTTAVPSARTLQRWFRRLGLVRPPRSELPPLTQQRASRSHEVWQMDASEAIPLATGAEVCWLRIVDEFTGAVLLTRVFSRGTLDERAGGGDHRGAA